MIKEIRKIGNSKGIILPKKVVEFLEEQGISEVKILIRNNNIILRKPKKNEKI